MSRSIMLATFILALTAMTCAASDPPQLDTAVQGSDLASRAITPLGKQQIKMLPGPQMPSRPAPTAGTAPTRPAIPRVQPPSVLPQQTTLYPSQPDLKSRSVRPPQLPVPDQMKLGNAPAGPSRHTLMTPRQTPSVPRNPILPTVKRPQQ